MDIKTSFISYICNQITNGFRDTFKQYVLVSRRGDFGLAGCQDSDKEGKGA